MAQLAHGRHQSILAQLNEAGPVSVQMLAQQLDVTKETIRRDLDQLETQGRLHRVHGGAVPAGSISRAEASLQDRLNQHTQQKQQIAQAALQFLPPATGGSMIIDAGTTTEALADLLADPALTRAHHNAADTHHRPEHRYLITNAVPIAHKLSTSETVDVELIGGSIRGVTGAAVGPDTTTALNSRRADVAFLATNGVDAGFGLSTPDRTEAAVKAAQVAAARRRVLLADSSKLGKTTLTQFATLADIDVLITDASPDDGLATALAEAEVEVVTP